MDTKNLDRPTPRDEIPYGDPINRNPYSFKPAEWFFKEAAATNSLVVPSKVYLDPTDQVLPVCSHGRIFKLQNDANSQLGLLLIQFMRPKVWRIRFYSPNTHASDFSDYNTRTIVQDTLSQLITVLDAAEKINWKVECHEVGPTYYVLQTVITREDNTREIGVQLWIRRNTFRISAVRSVAASPLATHIPTFQVDRKSMDEKTYQALNIDERPGSRVAIVWQTKEKPLQWFQNATILNLEKPLTAKYTGFGEQGGKRFFKDNTVMNYFNFDNMRYYNVYGDGAADGPLSDSEPLYHSEPYWIEMNAHPGARSQIATFVDNYSHVCVDVGRVNRGLMRIATRFNAFQTILMAGDDVGEIIRTYTSLIGRPMLKPRFVLGSHQGCYGYETQALVEEAVAKYRKYDIPLDGMHIDVDMQRGYRTFTIDTREGHFPQPQQMFKSLRQQGVKCSTNITPVVALTKDPDFTYHTYEQGLKNNYFVLDRRDPDPGVPDVHDLRYLQFGNGNRWALDPNTYPIKFPDPGYWIGNHFNNGQPFHGGVDYGDTKGAPGHYPNLNNDEVRKWWGTQYQYLFDTGLEFVWQDMTSPCMSRSYGDMCSWPFRLMLDNDGWSNDPRSKEPKHATKHAIEIWSLYSYNLHKATFQGLQNLNGRDSRRNFIIGRGSFAGAQRFAGLWTGDNVSSWQFLDISVSQVLALGLAGVTISGADVGGFEPIDKESFADPELVIRWYSAYSLLPWFRNHYVRKGKKLFQEPYGYYELQTIPNDIWPRIPESDRNMYYSVLPACRYIIQLRYTLLQLMYDAMFENMINGLPIARAMVITDPEDDSLYQSNEWYTRSQYLVRNDLLVAPALLKERDFPTRKLYLPWPNNWYPMNLRPGSGYGVALGERVAGGSHVKYDCHIGPNMDRLPYITPMYIREGAIIPQIETRSYVPDRTRDDESQPANPITINVYPGKDNSYDMYLDDGVSRESAPKTSYLAAATVGDISLANEDTHTNLFGDDKANNVFRQVHIEQTTKRVFEFDRLRDIRTVKISVLHDGYGDDKVRRDIGPEYKIVFWHAPREADNQFRPGDVIVTVGGTNDNFVEQLESLNATLVRVPTSASVSPVIEVSCPTKP